jgi:hypothetical protein
MHDLADQRSFAAKAQKKPVGVQNLLYQTGTLLAGCTSQTLERNSMNSDSSVPASPVALFQGALWSPTEFAD